MEDKNKLSTLFLKSTTQFSNKIAIKSGKSDISYLTLRHMTINLALHLANNGVRHGSIVAIETKNHKLLEIISILSLTMMGCTWIEFEEKYLKNKTIKIDFLIAKKPYKISDIQVLHVTDNSWLKKPENFLEKKHLNFAGYSSMDDPWFIATSSGSTGEPKLMPISSKMFYDRIVCYKEYDDSKEQLMFLDMFRQTSNLANLHFFFTIFKGGTYILNSSYDKMIIAGVRYVVGSPTHFLQLIQNISEPEKPLIYEARIVGSALKEQLLKRLLNYFQTVRVSYGSTEAGQTTTKQLRKHTTNRSVGKVYPGVKLEIVDDNNIPVEPTIEGNVRIKTKGQIFGYLNAVESTEKSFKNGWFYPGDKGYLSLSKELYIIGREKDHLNIGGAKINAVTIDELLQESYGVTDAICFAQSNEIGIDSLSALVMVKEGQNTKNVIQQMIIHVSSQLSRIKNLLSTVYITDKIPKNDNGKVMRHKAQEIASLHRPIKINYIESEKSNNKGVQK